MPNNRVELPIVIQESNALIDARVLHKKLQVKSIFVNWISRRIDEYGFESQKDFFPILEKSTGGRKPTSYLLTLDMAKELAMVERNEIGRAVRRYFIEKERQLRGLVSLPPAPALFKGLPVRLVNEARMYEYKPILERCGYSSHGGSRKARYWQHFVQEGKTTFITEQLALHLHHQRQVSQNRVKLKNMQPVLPFNSGNSPVTSHSNNN